MPPASSAHPASAAAAAAAAAFDPTARQRTAYARAGLSIAGFYYLRLCRASGRVEGLYFDPSAGSPFQRLELSPAPARVRPASACYFERRRDDGGDGEGEEKIEKRSGVGGEGKTEEGELAEKEGGEAGGGAEGAGAGAGGEGSDGGGAVSDDGGASAISSFAFN